MFENCGSCFAAEQFVDIRLGAKYLLTLTSYYYEREWRFMAMITLQNSRNAEVTVLTNNFIDNYMPGANGEFVKVYIYLLRLLSDTSVPFSLEQMADHFFCTERDIIRALKYWEKEKLLTLTYRNSEDIADIILNVPPVKSAASLMPNAIYELPYDGAKEMLLVDNVDNKDFLTRLFVAMYDELPAQKKKKS